ncbi:Exocyst complex component 4 [Homalodisca vitripennis]|nr:Exocyst complex component 4 [Homalodisca vitripennis]
MNVIRTLSTSESNEQRDKEKAKLEKDYQKCDKELDELISQHDRDLAQVMQSFARVSLLVNTSRAKISSVKENLLACKTLLSCRRDELKKLWLEGIEHKHTLQLLEEISQLKEVPAQLSAHLAKKHYLHATQVLVSALALGGSTLEDVEALRELRNQLEASKQQLYSKLLEELTRHIYVESTQELLTMRLYRQGSMRERESTPSSFDRSRRELTPVGVTKRESFRSKKRLDFSNCLKNERLTPGKVTEDVDAINPEEDSEHFMSILVECLGLLSKLPESVESLKVDMQTELLRLVERTTKSVVPTESATPLADLLVLLMEQFRAIVDAHRVVLDQIRRTAISHRVQVNVYDLPDVWARIQAVPCTGVGRFHGEKAHSVCWKGKIIRKSGVVAVNIGVPGQPKATGIQDDFHYMQLLLTDYLDIQNSVNEAHQMPSAFSEQSSNISSYFARRRQTSRSRRTPLFKFENSSHALTINSLMKEQSTAIPGFKKVGDTSQREKILVCQPDPNNITLIFIPLSKFLREIEDAMGCSPGYV